MVSPELIISTFSTGVFIRSLNYVNSIEDLKKIFFSLIAGLVALIAFVLKLEIPYNFGIYSLIFVGGYILFYSFTQMRKILPDISEQSVLQLSLIMLYIYDVNFYQADILGNVILYILIIFTLLTIFLGFINYILPNPLKLFFYVYFILLNTSIGLTYFSFKILNIFLKPDTAQEFNYYEAFFSGVTFMYLLANCFYIFWLIPIPGKNQSLKERLQLWKEFVAVLISKHSNAQLHPLQTSLNLIFIGGVLLINYFFKIFDNFTLVLVLLTLVQIFDAIFIRHSQITNPNYTPPSK